MHEQYGWAFTIIFSPASKKRGFHGSTAIRAEAGFGRHGKLQQETFLELAANLPIEVSFVPNAEEAEQFLALLGQENLGILYVKFPVEYDILPK